MPWESFQPGMKLTAGRMLSISPVWTDWTPVWTTSSGANTPSFGSNSTITARWAQSATTIFWRLDIVFGSTANFGGGSGSDNWRISAPAPAAAVIGECGYGEIQKAAAPGGYTNSAGTRQPLRIRLTTTTTFEFEMSGGNINAVSTATGAGLIDAVTPWAWDSGAALRAWGQYEAAA
ncbi:hypothetical protein GCM10010372_30480 [Streptomyces tauricus]|nr:hypothetical protein GCM10010372_30480 [Streptomyces tauricus]